MPQDNYHIIPTQKETNAFYQRNRERLKQEAQAAYQALLVEVEQLKKDNKRLTKRIKELEKEQTKTKPETLK